MDAVSNHQIEEQQETNKMWPDIDRIIAPLEKAAK